ncbi:aspartate--ammonia ligase [Barnesiella sp. An55]|uniref:aspartate--ammonia ligase n=1 Tax=Barnesiella sp. An55 TaxID=1965646 RepID=UPI000B3AE4C7|nr:aspartate--ammonia ligase [Barnesiella sp. An55]OUN70841.1 aspartate--ammonia ligase [Barnesiella sp. An55]HIZ27348.1 aspartate--ammonia ligase [Candidatus Barnesiella merdipullorum]
MSLIIPQRYKLKLLPETTEMAIKMLKDAFQERLAKALNLRRVTAPLFVLSGTGLNDDLNGNEQAVSFPIAAMGGRKAEVVHSLAKWKRVKLGAYDIAPGFGLYTDMNAIRTHEELDNLHSLYVDQWDWEKTITRDDRNVEYLKDTVRTIYRVIKECEALVYAKFPHITPTLPDEITFIHTEELLQQYPHLTPKEREAAVARRYGAVFLIGIGQQLSDGTRHDGRAPDYDDWTTPNSDGYLGLNGDIILWNTVLDIPFELSSMGIRVDREALLRQLDICGCPERAQLNFHRALLNDELPLSIGGGIGQSRFSMFLLQKAHIGEVQASIWPEEQIAECARHNIHLL